MPSADYGGHNSCCRHYEDAVDGGAGKRLEPKSRTDDLSDRHEPFTPGVLRETVINGGA